MHMNTSKAAESKKLNFKSLIQQTEVSLILIIAVLFLGAWIGTDNFITAYNLTNILKQSAVIGVIAVAETYVIITSGIDISCGAVVGMSTLMVALSQARWGLPIWVSIMIALAVGVICGLFNAAIIHEFNVPPMMATLGTQTILRGLIKVFSNGGTVSGIYKSYAKFASGSVLFLPNLAIVWILIAILCALLLKYSTFGRSIFVLGSGKEVARLNGISVRKTQYMTYGFAGLLFGAAGAMLAARMNCSTPTAGEGYEMNAIAASVLGGASLSGGFGSIVGTLLGTILIILIDNVGIQFGIDPFIMEVVTGAVIVIAVIVDQLKKRSAR